MQEIPYHFPEQADTTTAKGLVTEAFRVWEQEGDIGFFLRMLADDLEWTVTGNTPISGIYKSKEEYIDGVIKPLYSKLTGPVTCTVMDIIGEGDKVAVMWHGEAPTGEDPTTSPPYVNDYCWVADVDMERQQITRVIGFFDTAAVNALEKPQLVNG